MNGMLDIFTIIPIIIIGILLLLILTVGRNRSIFNVPTDSTQLKILKRYVLISSGFTTSMITILLLPSKLSWILYLMIWIFGFIIQYLGFSNAVKSLPEDSNSSK